MLTCPSENPANVDYQLYELPYRHSGYYPLFLAVARELKTASAASIVEVGCGTGGFAHLLLDTMPRVAYRGFDFSPVAVQRAKSRTTRPELFHVGDARLRESYPDSFDTIVCTEVLEHIERDLDVIERWPAGKLCVCSVPNFEASNHVRVFRSRDEVQHRYGSLIDITRIVEIKRPYLYDLSWQSYLREIRWNRYRPKTLMKILGLQSFDRGGGGLLFTGRPTPEPES